MNVSEFDTDMKAEVVQNRLDLQSDLNHLIEIFYPEGDLNRSVAAHVAPEGLPPRIQF